MQKAWGTRTRGSMVRIEWHTETAQHTYERGFVLPRCLIFVRSSFSPKYDMGHSHQDQQKASLDSHFFDLA